MNKQGHREEFGHREFKPTAADVAPGPSSVLTLMFVHSPFLGGGQKNIIIHTIGSKTLNARESTWEKLSGTNVEITGVM